VRRPITRTPCPRFSCRKKRSRIVREDASQQTYLCLFCGCEWRVDKPGNGLEPEDASKLREILGKAPVALRYGRISNPIEGSLARSKQDNATRAYWEAKLKDQGVVDGGFWFDEKISAYSIPFLEREDAREMFDYSRPGDHVVIQYLSRGWRNTRDALKCVDMFEDKGVHIHIMDFNVDTSTPSGRFALTIMAGVNQYEAEMTSLRNREDMAARREAGRSHGRPPIGWKRVEIGGLGYEAPNDEERWLANYLMEEAARGRTSLELSKELEKKGISARNSDTFRHQAVLAYIKAAKNGFPSTKERWNLPESVARRKKLAAKKSSRRC
jgi:DNA invertase Pin-like site-specific DNA recombinase